MSLPVPSSSWTVHQSGYVTPLGEREPSDRCPRRALYCRRCRHRFIAKRDRAHCSSRCYEDDRIEGLGLTRGKRQQ